MKLLVLASEPISAQQLRDAVSGNVDPAEAEVMLVAPALQENPLKFWFSDADSAIARAEQVRERSSSGSVGKASQRAATRARATRCRPSRTHC